MRKKKTVRGKHAPAPSAKKPKTKPKLSPLKIVMIVALIALVPAVFYTVIRIVISRLSAPAREANPPAANNDLILDEYRLGLQRYLSELKPLFRDKEFKGRASTDRLIEEYAKTAREILEADIIFYRHEDRVPDNAVIRIKNDLPLDDESIYGARSAGALDRALNYYRSVCHEKIEFDALFLAGRLSGPGATRLARLTVEADEIEKTLQGGDALEMEALASRKRPDE